MGFGLILGPQDAYPILKAADALQLMAFGPPKPQVPPAPDEWMRRFATLPLMHPPGERWMYNTGFEVLGVLIARASGQSLPTFLEERILRPLGMSDISFSVPAAKIDRFLPSYWMDGALYDDVEHSQWGRPPAFPSAAAGLVSTADDFLAFGQMMLDGGTHQGLRILSRDSVEAMTTDQLTPEQKAASPFFPGFWEDRGWGLGVSIVGGRFGWDGGLGTSWASEPREQMVAILMTQRAGPPQMSSIYTDFWAVASQTN
jgi:CubicO group peptidase (beta-lactamase class C family)